MFEWKVEELKLMNDPMPKNRYSFEDSIPREEKIAFVDAMDDGKLSKLLNLIDKFNEEKDSLPKDQYGDVKTVSLIAWIKRNDGAALIDTKFDYGQYNYLNCTRNICVNRKGAYDMYDDFVNEVFHRFLHQLKHKEMMYFQDNDPYCVAKTSLRKKVDEHRTTFGVRLVFSSHGEIYVAPIEQHDMEKREITLDEINILLDKFKKLEDYISKLTDEVDIKF